MKKRYKELTELEIRGDEAIVEGQLRHVQEAATELRKILASIADETLVVAPAVMEALAIPKITDWTHSQLEKEGIVVLWELDKLGKQNLNVHAKDEATAKKAINFFKNRFKETRIDIDEDSNAVFSSTDWKEFCTEYADFGYIAKVENPLRVILGSRTDHSPTLKDKVLKFVKENDRCNKSCPGDIFALILIKRHLQEKLEAIGESFPSQINVSVDTESDTPSIHVEGKKTELDAALAKVKELISSIKTKDHMVTQHGMYDYFSKRGGKNIITVVESKHPAKIHVGKQAFIDEGSATYTIGGVVVVVIQEDLTRCRVDALVNPANQGDHGRLAKGLYRKGG